MATRKFGNENEVMAAFKAGEINLDQYTEAIKGMVVQDRTIVEAGVCPLSLEEFLAGAKQISIVVGNERISGQPRENKSGSFGWNLNGKATITVGDVPCQCQVTANVTLVNSKEAPRTGKVPPAKPGAKISRVLNTPARTAEEREQDDEMREVNEREAAEV